MIQNIIDTKYTSVTYSYIGEEEESEERVKKTALGILDTLKLFWYKLLYFLYNPFEFEIEGARNKIFTDNLSLVRTKNMAKYEDLRGYVVSEPLKTKTFTPLANQFGSATESETVAIQPFGGNCFGAVIHFFQKTLEVGADQAAQEFENGIPVQAAVYQAIYRAYDGEFISQDFVDSIIAYLDSNMNFVELANIFPKLAPYKDALNKSDFDFLKSELKDYYASIRAVEQHYTEKDIRTIDEDRFGFALAGLQLEVIQNDVKPQDILSSLTTDLQPGLYYLPFKTGSYASHATGICINKDRTFHFLEPNFGIGKMPIEKIERTIERTFCFYGKKVMGCSLIRVASPWIPHYTIA